MSDKNLDEVYDALKKVKYPLPYSYKGIYDHEDCYRFDPKMTNYGVLKEPPCCGAINHGQFDALVERGDCLAIFTGHDHTNGFGVKYKGVDIVNSLSTRYQNDCFSTQYGYRIIDVDERNTAVYSTRVVHWYNIYKPENLSGYKNKDELVWFTSSVILAVACVIARFTTSLFSFNVALLSNSFKISYISL